MLLNDGSDDLRRRLGDLILGGPTAELADKPGGVFLRDASALSMEEKTLLKAAARVVLRDNDGTLAEQLSRPATSLAMQQSIRRNRSDANRPLVTSSVGDASAAAGERLLFDNGMGGFTRGWPRIRSLTARRRLAPGPLDNVLANPGFGCLVTEAGGGFTWAGNSQMNRLTPWSNDPVSDPPGEVVYLRDEETGEFWTPTPAP